MEANAAEVEQLTRVVMYAALAVGAIGWVVWRTIRRR